MTQDDHVAKIDAVLPGRWDVDALRAGASVCLVMAIPFRVLAAVLDSDSGALNAVFFLAFVVFFIIGAGCAAWVQRSGTPLSHALVVAVGTYAASETVFIAIRLIRGTSVPWLTLLFTLSIISVAGLIGGYMGSNLQRGGFVPSSRR